MASSNPKADRLAKSLQLCLSQALGGISRLRQLGWFELLQDDWPQSDVASRVACEALFHLAFDDAGQWNRNPAVIVGIVSFLKQQTGKFPTSVYLNDLKAMLESNLIDRQGVEQWFHMVYGR
ncbi:MAG: hypothetical protein HY000_13400 [Planctomycetes bacterium]|nr:hypothetical protein [Planctomycetota bacterium]